MKVVSNTVYTISDKDGRVLEVANFNFDNGAAVQLWDNAKEDSQKWLIVEVAEGLYKIQNKLTGKVLDVMMSGAENGTWLHQWDYIGKDNQLWTVEETAKGVKFRSKLSDKPFETIGYSANGARLQIWEDRDGDAQVWYLKEVKETKAPAKQATKTAVAKAEKAVKAVTSKVKKAVKADTVKVEKDVKTVEKAVEAKAVEAVKTVKPDVAKTEAKAEKVVKEIKADIKAAAKPTKTKASK